MALTFVKKIAPKEQVTEAAPQVLGEEEVDLVALGAAIDEVGKAKEAVDKAAKALADKAAEEIRKLNEAEKKFSTLNAQLIERANKVAKVQEKDANEKISYEGKKYKIDLSAQGKLRSIKNLQMIKDIMEDSDPTLFMKVVKVDMKDLDAYLTPEELSMTVATERKDRTAKVSKKP